METDIISERFWEELLSSMKQFVAFSAEATASSGFELKRKSYRIPRDSFYRLMSICKNSYNSLFVVLTSYLLILLYKQTKHEVFSLGMPVYTTGADSNPDITHVPLIHPIDTNLKLKEFIKGLVSKIKDTIINQYFFSGKILEKNTGDIENPDKLMRIIISLKELHVQENIMNIKSDLHFNFYVVNEQLKCDVRYNVKALGENDIDRFFSDFNSLCRNVTENLSLSIKEINCPAGDPNYFFTGTPGDVERKVDESEDFDQLKEKVTAVWRQVLNINNNTRIDPDKSFFNMGGNSLKLIFLENLLNDNGIKIELLQLFEYPTVRNICEHIMKSNKQLNNKDHKSGEDDGVDTILEDSINIFNELQ